MTTESTEQSIDAALHQAIEERDKAIRRSRVLMRLVSGLAAIGIIVIIGISWWAIHQYQLTVQKLEELDKERAEVTATLTQLSEETKDLLDTVSNTNVRNIVNKVNQVQADLQANTALLQLKADDKKIADVVRSQLSGKAQRTEVAWDGGTVGGLNGKWFTGQCPDGFVVDGVKLFLGGTCGTKCDPDGRPVASVRLVCRRLLPQ